MICDLYRSLKSPTLSLVSFRLLGFFNCVCVPCQFGKEWFKQNWLLFIAEENVKSRTPMDRVKFITQVRSLQFFICAHWYFFLPLCTPSLLLDSLSVPMCLYFRPSPCEQACFWPCGVCVHPQIGDLNCNSSRFAWKNNKQTSLVFRQLLPNYLQRKGDEITVSALLHIRL